VEVEGERLEGELKGLRAQLEGLEREGVEGGGRRGDEGDEVLYVLSGFWKCGFGWIWLTFVMRRLKLQVYRSLGIDVSQDAQTGAFDRAVIRNSAKGDVNVIRVDGKVDRGIYANMFWDSL
jgi:kinetochore protein Spc24